MIVRGRELLRDLTLDVDAVVVGTGAGGSVALRELARAGLRAVALEQGAYSTPSDFTQREDEMLPRLFQDGGGRMTDDLAIRVLQGRGVGGSTVHNTNLCKRTPDAILDLWAKSYGVSGAGPKDLAPAFARIEKELSVTPMLAEWENGNNLALRRGVTALGWKGASLSHNRVGCQQSGFCELGCSYDAKQNALKVILPQAILAGADVYSDVHVTRVLEEKGRAAGVLAVALGEDGRPRVAVTVRARVVVLAGSAVGSAALGLASGLPDPYDRLGRGLRLHPGGVVAGHFDRAIDAAQGIPQSYECTELLSFEPGSDKRVWIVPAFAHPIGTAATLPGFGGPHMKAMRSYDRLAVLTAMVHDETSGRVTVTGEGRPVLHYEMNDGDRGQLAQGLIACARLLFAAGAREVTIPAVYPVRVTREAELEGALAKLRRPHVVPLTAVHPMGTLCMGDDPKSSVVSSRGEHHQVKGLFVADGSLFPTSIGVPPQISIYSFALHLAPHIIESAKGERP
jgi:choline dehydrogenase-like flavoprotein